MFLANYLQHPGIQPFVKEIGAGHYLFRQGEQGSTMFMILDGMVQLFDEASEKPTLIGTYGPSQFFGEKVMINQATHQRFFSAQAKTKSMVLEFGLKDVHLLSTVIPDFAFILFQAAAQRLEKAYYLIRLLQSDDDFEKLAHCLLYFFRSPGIDARVNRAIPVTSDDIHFLIRMNRDRMDFCLRAFAQKGAIEILKDGSFTLKDPGLLMVAATELKDTLTKAA